MSQGPSHPSSSHQSPPLIPKHGGYRDLLSFQVSRLIFDITVRFCKSFVSKFSRTHDQMIQAARSGVQNIAEGSQASGTSKETEMQLTNVARASLEELRLDYEDFLRHNNLPMWEYNDHRRQSLVRLKPSTADQFAFWAGDLSKKGMGTLPEIAANGLLTLISVANKLLQRQVASLAETFLREGGFKERLYKARVESRKLTNHKP